MMFCPVALPLRLNFFMIVKLMVSLQFCDVTIIPFLGEFGLVLFYTFLFYLALEFLNCYTYNRKPFQGGSRCLIPLKISPKEILHRSSIAAFVTSLLLLILLFGFSYFLQNNNSPKIRDRLSNRFKK